MSAITVSAVEFGTIWHQMRGFLLLVVASFSVNLTAQSPSNFGPLPDGVQFPVAASAQLNSATMRAGDTVKFKMLNNLRGPGGAVALPKDADLLGRVDHLETKSGGDVRLRLTVHRAEWPGGGMDLHAFITFINSGGKITPIPLSNAGTANTKKLHAEISAEPEVGIDLVSERPIVIEKDEVVTIRQTTRADRLLAQTAEPFTPGTTIRAVLNSFIDVSKCKQGDAVKFQSLGELHGQSGELIMPNRTDLFGHVVQCNPRGGSDGEAVFSAIVDNARWGKSSLKLHMAVEIPGSNPQPKQPSGGRTFTTVVVMEKGSVPSPAMYGNSISGAGMIDNPFEEVQFKPSTSPTEPGSLVSKSRNFRFAPGVAFALRQLPANQ